MNSNYLIAATVAMATVTFIIRATPALIPKRILDTPWLHRLNESLPLSVMTLLILTSLSYQDVLFSSMGRTTGLDSPELHLLLAQLGAIAIVLLIYHFSRQLLVSMVAGIMAINGLLWVLAAVFT